MSGLEPLAFGLRNRRSSRLSYTPRAAPVARRRPGDWRQHFIAGLVRAYAIPTRVVRLVWCSHCAVINRHARSPVGGAPQGWQDSNLRQAVLEAAVLAAELHPYETENRPLGVPPASGSWSGPSDRGRYPVAAPRVACPLLPRAALIGEKAGMHGCRKSRSYLADQSVTWLTFPFEPFPL